MLISFPIWVKNEKDTKGDANLVYFAATMSDQGVGTLIMTYAAQVTEMSAEEMQELVALASEVIQDYANSHGLTTVNHSTIGMQPTGAVSGEGNRNYNVMAVEGDEGEEDEGEEYDLDGFDDFDIDPGHYFTW